MLLYLISCMYTYYYYYLLILLFLISNYKVFRYLIQFYKSVKYLFIGINNVIFESREEKECLTEK